MRDVHHSHSRDPGNLRATPHLPVHRSSTVRRPKTSEISSWNLASMSADASIYLAYHLSHLSSRAQFGPPSIGLLTLVHFANRAWKQAFVQASKRFLVAANHWHPWITDILIFYKSRERSNEIHSKAIFKKISSLYRPDRQHLSGSCLLFSCHLLIWRGSSTLQTNKILAFGLAFTGPYIAVAFDHHASLNMIKLLS